MLVSFYFKCTEVSVAFWLSIKCRLALKALPFDVLYPKGYTEDVSGLISKYPLLYQLKLLFHYFSKTSYIVLQCWKLVLINLTICVQCLFGSNIVWNYIYRGGVVYKLEVSCARVHCMCVLCESALYVCIICLSWALLHFCFSSSNFSSVLK